MRRPIDEGDDSFQVSASGMVAPCWAHSVHPLRILQLCYRGAQYLVDLRMAGQHPHVSAAGEIHRAARWPNMIKRSGISTVTAGYDTCLHSVLTIGILTLIYRLLMGRHVDTPYSRSN